MSGSTAPDAANSAILVDMEFSLTDVAVLVREPVPAFELGVVCEVFGLDRSGEALPAYRFAVCSDTRRPLLTTSGFTINPTHGPARLAAADLVIVAAAPPPQPRLPAALVRHLHRAVDRGAVVAAVCLGAFTLAAAGLLDGRRATTHWQFTDRLDADYPTVAVEPDALYVADGSVYTSAGSAAALDLCLNLVRRAHGAHVANQIARRIVTPPHRDGGQSQYLDTPMPPPIRDGGLGDLLDWLSANLGETLSVADMANHALMSPRTFARRFHDTTGMTPRAWLDRQRLLAAQQMLETSDATLDTIARTTGYQTTDTLRRHVVRARGVTPDTYRRAFRERPGRSHR